MELTEKDLKLLRKCIETEQGFTCKNISLREMSKNANKDYNEYLDSETKEDKKYLKELDELKEKLKQIYMKI